MAARCTAGESTAAAPMAVVQATVPATADGRGRLVRWPANGAIAADAAIGVIGAAAAASWAGPPPGPGLCWYYADPSRQRGFWDACQ